MVAEPLLRSQMKLLLGSLREGREVRQYLEQFGAAGDGCFAVIKVGGAILDDHLDGLAQRLALLQNLGLKPVLVYGSGPQLDKELAAAGFETERRQGLRITPAEAMPVLARTTAEAGLAIAEAVRQHSGATAAAPPGALRVRAIDSSVYGRVGSVSGVNAPQLSALIERGLIPIIGCTHLSDDGSLLNVNADEVARSLALALKPQKIIFLTGVGGLLGKDGTVINSVNLATDWPELKAAPWLDGGMRVKIEEIRQLLEQLPMQSSVSITSVSHLMRELFTHGGAGTLLRRGERIITETECDPEWFATILEQAFGRPLSQGYLTNFVPSLIIRSERSRALAALRREGEVTVLDKFAVLPEARGEGLARAVWAVIRHHSDTLVWRSRSDNPFNAFYNDVADGWRRAGPWRVYWCGEKLEAALRVGAELAARPPDFEAAP